MSSVNRTARSHRVDHAHARHISARAHAVAHHGNRAVATSFVHMAPRTALADMSVQERFATLQSRFNASAASGVDVRFQFDITGPGGGQWYCTIKGGKLTVKAGTGPNPTATLHASSDIYLKIANGKMNKMWALVQGKLKVEGDTGAMKKWDTYFND